MSHRMLVVVLAAGVLASTAAAASSPGPLGPENVPVPKAPALALPASPALGQSVDGIRCERSEQVRYHIHAHLTLFVNGKARQVPYGIGISPPLGGFRT